MGTEYPDDNLSSLASLLIECPLIRESQCYEDIEKRVDTSVVELELKSPRSTHGFFSFIHLLIIQCTMTLLIMSTRIV